MLNPLVEYLFFLGRILFGGYFFWNGLNHFTKGEMMAGYAASKNVPLPKLAVYASGLLIFLGGAGVLIGNQIYTTWSLAMIIVFLVLVTFKMHNYWKDQDPNAKMMNMLNFMKNMALLGATLMLLALPIWPYPLF